jgi:hypothetical protein
VCLNGRRDEFGEPAGRRETPSVGWRRCAYWKACLVLHHDPHVTYRAQLDRQVRQKLFCGQLLMREPGGVADERFGKAYGGRHFNAGLRARPQHCDAAADEQHADID